MKQFKLLQITLSKLGEGKNGTQKSFLSLQEHLQQKNENR